MTAPGGSRLARIGCPGDLRALPAAELPGLAQEIRDLLVSSVPRTGGHLGPNLGVVELTLAVHRVFDSPVDAIVWDTGHQTYVHKMLTGRWAQFPTLRQGGGLSGYPSRSESPHDLVENSHASTALAYADGLATAFALRGEHERRVVAVVGDGALTGGLSWEALNNLGGAPERPVIVVLNDNGRSYAPTVGGLAAYLGRLRAAGAGARPTLFDELGLDYVGPVDGHDTVAVEAALREARDRRRPALVHCVTQKGRGYRPAEDDETDRMHAVSPSPAGPVAVGVPAWTDVVAAELAALAAGDPRIVAVTAAMLDPTGLTPMARGSRERVRDVGIAEQHAVTSAAGMAMGGLHPVVAVYATFLNRAFDQLMMDVALHRLPVTFLLDRAGITGPDGASHHGMWDLSLLGLVPGLRVAAPRDADTLREVLGEAVADDGPTAIRYPRGRVPAPLRAVARLGSADVLQASGSGRPTRTAGVLLIGVGALAGTALAAAEELTALGVPTTTVDPRWVQPVDPALVRAAGAHRLTVTLEDNGVAGGYGDAFCRAVREAHVPAAVATLGLPQRFLPHGDRASLLAAAGLDPAGVVDRVLAELGPRLPVTRQDSLRASAR